MSACILACCIGTAFAADIQLQQLMSTLSQRKSGNATFVEKKYLAIIDEPVVSTGRLSYVAPNHLEKRTLTPNPETLILDGDTLTIEQPGMSEDKVSLDEHPEVSAFIESIRGTLAGDLLALQKYYRVELSGSDNNWLLKLTPKDDQLSRNFSQISIGGSHADVKTIRLDQSDGDHSVMSITDTGQ